MARRNKVDGLLRGYLLGELSPEETAFVGRRLLTSIRIADELLAAEDELIDQYLGGELTEGESKEFERHFLQDPARVAKLQFSRVFQRYVRQRTA
jgi:anti-sigma factor RsiW